MYVLLIDESESMSKSKVIESVNTFIEKRKHRTEPFTLITFNQNFRYQYFNVPFNMVPPFTNYNPSGSTSFYDCLGFVLNQLKNYVNVVFTVITDGCDNTSREFTINNILKEIENKRKNGWKFNFIYLDDKIDEERQLLGGTILEDEDLSECLNRLNL